MKSELEKKVVVCFLYLHKMTHVIFSSIPFLYTFPSSTHTQRNNNACLLHKHTAKQQCMVAETLSFILRTATKTQIWMREISRWSRSRSSLVRTLWRTTPPTSRVHHRRTTRGRLPFTCRPQTSSSGRKRGVRKMGRKGRREGD